MKQWVTIDISMRAILKVVGVLLGLWFLFAIRDIVLLFFIVIIVVMALAPIIDKMQGHMPRAAAVGLVFVVLLAVLTLIISLIIPPVIGQITELTYRLPEYARHFQELVARYDVASDGFNVAQRTLQTVTDQLSQLSSGIVQTTLGFLGGVVSFVTIIVLSFYLLLEEKGIRNVLVSLLPISHKDSVLTAFDKVGLKLGAWLRGQLLLMVIIGISTGIWATVLGLPYGLTLALWSGLTEVIPYLGPIIGGIPLLMIAFIDSPVKALIAFILLAVTQQLESNFIVPKVMQRSVGLSPVIVILALLIGGKLFGVQGTLLSVPVAATVSVIVQEWPKLIRAFTNRTKIKEDETLVD